jgi:tetratricopeptide (TPR) repeat protein
MISDGRSHLSALTLPLLAGAALLLLGNALLTDAAFIKHLGDRAARVGDYGQAIAYYHRAIQADPDAASAPCALALAVAASGDLLQAQRLLEQNLKLHPRDAASNEALADLVVRSLGETAYVKVQGYYETALAGDPTRPGSALVLSRIYLSQNRLLDAGRILAKPLEAHPRNAKLHLQLATLYALAGEYELSSKEFNAATALDPTNAEAYCSWGVTRIAAGDARHAEPVLRKALELQPDNPLYHVQLGRALRDLGRMDESEKELTTALRKDIHCVPVYLEIASTFQEAHDDATADRYLRQCVQINPASNEARIALADFLTNSEDPLRRNLWEAASLRQACVNDTKEPDAALLLGAAQGWERVHQEDRSLALIDKALAWEQLHGASPANMELLRKFRQQYVLALVPPRDGPPTFRSVDGRVVPDAVEEPWPAIRQPAIESLLDRPARLDQPPGPGSIFDPSLYSDIPPSQPAQPGKQP